MVAGIGTDIVIGIGAIGTRADITTVAAANFLLAHRFFSSRENHMKLEECLPACRLAVVTALALVEAKHVGWALD
jgi:hypothetical protein